MLRRHRARRAPRRGGGVLIVALIAGVAAACGSGAPAPSRTAARSGTPTASTSPPASATPPPAPAWPVYHRDGGHEGNDPATAAGAGEHLFWRSPRLDGAVYAEPLVAEGMVIVATEDDSVYALDAAGGRQVWRAHVGEPVAGASLPCGDIDPIGITGTPAVDVGTRTVYAVASVQPLHHVLVALNLADGAVRWQRTVDPPGSQPLVQQQRGALGLAGGHVYIPFGGRDGDCGAYHGWVAGAAVDGSGALSVFEVAAPRQGGVWAPSGVTVDAGGDVLVTSGNSSNGSAPNFDSGTATGNTVFRLDPSLRQVDSFTPADWARLNSTDTDLGSTGPLLVGSNLVFQVGKAGVGYLLDAAHLGGVGGQVFSGQVCAGGAYGGTAYASPYVYVACTGGLVALRVDPAARTFTVAWTGPRFDAGAPIVTGDAVWSVDLGGAVIYALDAASGSVRFHAPLGGVEKFETPAAAGGTVFAGAGDTVVAFAG